MPANVGTNPLSLVTRDALAASLRRIDTLAGLLCAASEQAVDDTIDCELVGDAAGMIAEETARLRAVLGPFLEPLD